MANFSDRIADMLTGIAIQLERAKAGQIRFVNGRLNEMGRGIIDILRRNERTLIGPRSSPARRAGVYRGVTELIGDTYGGIRRAWPGTLTRISSWYVERTANDINRAAGIPLYRRLTDKQIQRISEQVLIDGAPSAEWWSTQNAKLKDKFVRQMRQGVANNESLGELTRRVRGTAARGFSDGIMLAGKQDAEALIRTSVQAASGAARLRQYEESVGVKALQHLSTLDSKTCLIAGTPVLTASGYLPIESIITGDIVVGGSGEHRQVIGTTRAESSRLARVTLSNGERVVCTVDHLWLTDEGWKEAQSLCFGEKLKTEL